MKALFLLVTLSIISGCSTHRQLPKDFSFRVEDSYESAFDRYDSEKNEYQRNYTNGVAKIKVKLTNEEKVLINSYFEEANFSNFPEEFKSIPNKDGEIDLSDFPGTTIKISLKSNGNSKIVLYNSSDTSEEFKNRTQKFIKLNEKIWQILKKKQKVKKLKESDFIFL